MYVIYDKNCAGLLIALRECEVTGENYKSLGQHLI